MTTPRRRRGRRGGGTGDAHDAPVPGSSAGRAPDADPESVARAIALRQLTMAPRSRAQLSDAMAKRGVPDEVAEAVLDRFEEVRLVDDEDFARQWVETRHAGRGLSRRALRHELRARGVADETVEAAVDEISPEAELEAARQLVRRRMSGMASDDPVRRTRRLAGMLARKGYGTSVAFRAIRDVMGEQVDDEELGG
jgi:regulatory protein